LSSVATTTGRHTLRGFARGAVSRVIGEEGAVRTGRELLRRPGVVIRDYVAGGTAGYVHPVSWLLLAVAVFVLGGRVTLGSTGAPESDRIWMLLLIPFIAVASRITFWRGPYNLAEHLIMVVYLSAQVLLILTVLSVGMLVLPARSQATYALVTLVVAAAWFVWGCSRVFERYPWRAAPGGVIAIALGAAGWVATVLLLVTVLRR
jgi:hypothetical protein